MRNAGFAPEEVGTRRELAAVEAEIAQAGPGADHEALRRRRLALELKRNLATDKRLGRI